MLRKRERAGDRLRLGGWCQSRYSGEPYITDSVIQISQLKMLCYKQLLCYNNYPIYYDHLISQIYTL